MPRQVIVEILGNDKDFRKALGSAGDAAEGFGAKFKTAAKVVVAGGVLIGGAAVLVGTKVLEAGAKLDQMDAKADTVFGDQVGKVRTWAKESAAAMGLTQRAATGLAANFGDLLVPMGFTRKEAAAMSTKVIGLSGALSEWSGGTRSAAEVSEILAKAMLGERDGLKELGISINEADVQARLAKNGTEDLTGAALEQAKALATQQLIFEKSTDAQAAFAAGTSEGIRTQAEMNAAIGEVTEELITNLYPVVLQVATFLKDVLPGAIQFAKDAWMALQPAVAEVSRIFSELATMVMPLVAEASRFVGEEVVPALGAAWRWIEKNVMPAVNDVFNFLAKDVLPVVGVVVGWISKSVVPALGQAWSWISKNIMPAVGAAIDFITKTVLPALGQAVNWIVKNILPPLGTLMNNFSKTVLPAVAAGFDILSKTVIPAVSTALGFITKNVIPPILAGFNLLKQGAGFLGTAFGALASKVKTAWSGILNAIRGVINTIIRGWNSLQFTLPAVDTPFGRIGGFTIGTPNIPYMHTGGIVPGTPGSNQLAMLQAGERVIPRGAAGGTTIIVQGNVYGVDDLMSIIAMRLKLDGA